jgi:hypothetical protein
MRESEFIRREIARGIADSFTRFLLGEDSLSEESRPHFTIEQLTEMLISAEEREKNECTRS